MTLIVLCGLPGSGKTTTARAIAADIGAIRMCPDEWMTRLAIDLYDEPARARVEALQWLVTQEMLALGHSVVLEWGVWSRAERDTVRERARELGVRVQLLYLDVPLDVIWERLDARNKDLPWGTAGIERADLERWSTMIEIPDADEQALFDPPTAISS